MTCQTEPCRTAAGTAPFRGKSDDEQFVMLLRELIDPAYRCGIFSRKSKKTDIDTVDVPFQKFKIPVLQKVGKESRQPLLSV